MATNTVDNLLFFVSTYFDKLDRQSLNSLLVDFYTLDEFVISKNLLIAQCEKIAISDAISEFKKKRLLTKTEIDLKHKVSKDVLDIWTVVDVQKGGSFQTIFQCSDPPHLPSASSPPSAIASLSSQSSASSSQPSPPPQNQQNLGTNEPNLQQIFSLLLDLKKEVDHQNESIKWLTNIAKNIYQEIPRLDTFPSVLDDSIDSGKLPKSVVKG